MNMKRQDAGGFENRDEPEGPERRGPAGGESDMSPGAASGPDRQGASSTSSSSREGGPPSGTSPRLAQRLRGILRSDDGEADLALQGTDLEGGLLRWLQALDLQVIGACRADERLKPLLKLNFSCGAAEDHLLAQLSQHFEASEVGMLVRCLCVPLVSMRVGRVNKQGNMLLPTNIRGYLNLILSPSSDMRILFCGDDGCTERLAVVAHNEDSEVSLKEILADASGRSFLLRLPEGNVSYFWCSEKSKQNGEELLEKLHSLFQNRPSLAQLTGISEVRLESFATHMRTYLLGSARSSEAALDVSSTATALVTSSMGSQSASLTVKSARSRHSSGQTGKCHPVYQGCLSPKPNMFKDSISRSLPSLRNGTREKLKRRVDGSNLLPSSTVASAIALNSCANSVSCHADVADKSESDCCNHSTSLPELPSCPSLAFPSVIPLNFQLPFPQVAAPSSALTSPYYCWCPPCTSPIQSVGKPELPPCLGPETLPLPPLSSLLSTSSIPLQPSNQSLDCSELPVLDFPSLFPVNSYVSLPSSQQIPTFTPFMADPIVHIPVIDICSSGPGYLVSAGPAISSAIPPLLPSLTPEPASVVENNARETLRMLIASSPPSQSMAKMLPAALTRADESSSYADGQKRCLLVTGSRGLYTGAQDVDAVVGGVGWLGLAPLSFERSSFAGDSSVKEKDPNPSSESQKQKEVTDDQTKKPEP